MRSTRNRAHPLAPRRQALELPHGARRDPGVAARRASGWARARSRFFDNGATPKEHPQSRALVLSIDPQHATAQLQSSFVHHLPLVAPSQGNLQSLPDGHWFVGWGQEPYFSEFSPSGALLLDGHLPKTYQSFTVLKLPWSGRPRSRLPWRRAGPRPAASIVARELERRDRRRLLAGARRRRPGLAAPLARAPSDGFETAITLLARAALRGRPGARRTGAAAGHLARARGPRPLRRTPAGPRRCQSSTSTRPTLSATHTGFSPPSISTVSLVTTWCQPPPRSSTSTICAKQRRREPTGTGAGKRTLFQP